MTENINVKWCKRKMLFYNENELITCINTSGLKTKDEIISVLRKDKNLIEFINQNMNDENKGLRISNGSPGTTVLDPVNCDSGNATYRCPIWWLRWLYDCHYVCK